MPNKKAHHFNTHMSIHDHTFVLNNLISYAPAIIITPMTTHSKEEAPGKGLRGGARQAECRLVCWSFCPSPSTGAPEERGKVNLLDMISRDDTIPVMTTKHRKTLQAVFGDPVKANILWADIEALFLSFGAERDEGSGSRIRFFLNGIRATFHRPHPQKETDRGAVKSVRKFLTEARIRP